MSNTDDLNQMEKLKFKSFNLSNWKLMVSHSVNVSCMRAVQVVQFDQIETAIFNLTRVLSSGLPQCSSVLHEGCSNGSIWSNLNGNFQFDSGFFKWSPSVFKCPAWELFKWFNLIKLIKLKRQFSIWLGSFQMVSHSDKCSCMRAVQIVQFDQIERQFSIWLGLFQMVSHRVNVSCVRAVQMVQFDQIDQIEKAIFNLTLAFSTGLPQC